MAAPVEQHRFAEVDWDDLVARLTAEAIVLCGGPNVVLQGVGVSPEDLVAGTMAKLFEDTSVRYRKDRGPLLAYLKTVMRHDFLDLKKRAAYRTTVTMNVQAQPGGRDDERGQPFLDGLPAPPQNQPDVICRERVGALVADDTSLSDLVTAILDFGCDQPADIAELLATAVADVENRRKRLRRLLVRNNVMARG